MDRREAIDILVGVIATNTEEENEALDLAIEALGQTEIVRCKDCKHYNPPHIEYNDGTRKDYPDELVTVDIGMNVGGKCENSTTTMRTYCTAHDRENPDDFEELVIFRQPMEYCSFGEKAEKHQLSGETSTISEKESVEDDAEQLKVYEAGYKQGRFDESADMEYGVGTDCISRADTIKAMCQECRVFPDDEVNCADCTEVAVIKGMPPVNQKQITGKLETAENATSEGEESTIAKRVESTNFVTWEVVSMFSSKGGDTE